MEINDSYWSALHDSHVQEIDDLKFERDALQARVAELEEANQALVDAIHKQLRNPEWTEFQKKRLYDWCLEHVKPLNRTPRQSLASIKVQALREAANNGRFDGCMWQIGDILEAEADRLEKEASD